MTNKMSKHTKTNIAFRNGGNLTGRWSAKFGILFNLNLHSQWFSRKGCIMTWFLVVHRCCQEASAKGLDISMVEVHGTGVKAEMGICGLTSEKWMKISGLCLKPQSLMLGRELQELPWATPLRLVVCHWNATKWSGIVVNVWSRSMNFEFIPKDRNRIKHRNFCAKSTLSLETILLTAWHGVLMHVRVSTCSKPCALQRQNIAMHIQYLCVAVTRH